MNLGYTSIMKWQHKLGTGLLALAVALLPQTVDSLTTQRAQYCGLSPYYGPTLPRCL